MRSSLPLSLSVLAGCAAASATPMPSTTGWTGAGNPGIAPAITTTTGMTPELAAVRAQGPVGLEHMLQRYDELPPGEERIAMEKQIDAIAGQRYATVSRLYWYTDLAAAEAAAKAQDKPILALRMLGRLDEELSCANSRFFRTALYANTGVSDYLRDHFVLYWSSERPVPRVTFDFGDGRRIVRTTTGNSAHYVLDQSGTVIDVLPGLYAPSVFRAELETAEALWRRVAHGAPEQRMDKVDTVAIVEHHRLLAADRSKRSANLSLPYVPGSPSLLALGAIEKAAMMAQRVTVSKAAVEVPDFVALGVASTQSARDDRAAWAAIGQAVWKLEGTPTSPPQILDEQSRALVMTLQSAVPAGVRKPSKAELMGIVARYEQSIVADTAINELVLRPQISSYIASTGTVDFETLNAMVYESVFFTPKSDPWLNLLPRDEFTGLPGDGVLMQ